MTDLLNRKNRGGTWDQVFPVPAAIRPAPLPRVVLNDYLAHRLTSDAPGNRLACDCGDTFDTATELGQHQQRYRHPRR